MSKPMLSCLRYLLIVFAFGVSVLASSVVLAQGPILDALKPKEEKQDEPAADNPPADVETKREDAAEKLRVAQRELDTARAASPAGAAPATTEKAQEVNLRDQIERVLAQQQDAERRKKELEASVVDLEKKQAEILTKGDEEPPARSFLLLDEARDNLDSESKRKESIRAAVASATAALDRAKSIAEEKERRRLTAKEALASNKSEAKASKKAKTLATAELELELAKEVLNLRRMDLENEQLSEKVFAAYSEFLKAQVAWLSRVARFDDQDLKAQIESLEKRAADLKEKLERAEPEATKLEDRWYEARRRADMATEKKPSLDAEVDARRMAYLVQHQQIAVYNARIRRLGEMRTAWNRRYQVATEPADTAEFNKWAEETEQAIEQLKSEAVVQSQKAADIRKKLAVLSGNAQEDMADDPELAVWTEMQRENFEELSQTYEANLISIETSLRVHEKLLTEIRGDEGPSIGSHFESAWQWMVDAWNYPVATYDDRPITIRKIVIGIVLLIIGIFASRLLSRILGRRLLTRMGVHSSASSAIQTVTFYLLLIFFALFALHIANVPLTALTILGGAAALGIGFGSQNIINNFISGLILLAERPIRVGDLIEVEGVTAVVEKIGARSTWLKTGANFEIIVPNSKFLESNVTNWTLSDSTARCDIKVGVVYGSPTKKVEELLIKAAKVQEMVMVDPEPFVWFLDFADNSLNFQLNFWMQMSSLARRMAIESQIRFTIDKLFRDADIVIAFPQRDIHLDTTKPLEIRVLPPDGDSPKLGRSSENDAA